MKHTILIFLCIFTLSHTEESLAGGADPLHSFETDLEVFMDEYNIPGASVAIMKEGRLLYARGFGYGDQEGRIPVQPNSIFRIGSISKVFTTIAIMQLVEQGKVNLNDKAHTFFHHLELFDGMDMDYRFRNITIRDLLQMTSGMGASPNRVGFIQDVIRLSDEEGLPSKEDFLRYMMGQSLHHAPGLDYTYSNSGFNILAHIVEKVTGQEFNDYVKAHILQPLGLHSTFPARTLMKDRRANEVKYYAIESSRQSIFPGVGSILPCQYGGCFYLEAQFGSGAWISTAEDLTTIFTAARRMGPLPPLLSAQSVSLLDMKPAHIPAQKGVWHGLGWNYVQTKNGLIWKKGGSLPGTATRLMLTPRGVAIAVLFNTRPKKTGFHKDLNRILNRTASQLGRGQVSVE